MTPSTICDEDIDAKFGEIIAAEWPKLEGRQTPNSLAYTPGDVALGLKAVELAKRSASRIRAMPWQSWSLERIMSKAADGTWTHPECCLIVPRQNGKSLILSLRVLYGLFKLGEKIVFSAQQWETAKALWKRTWAIVKTTPWMRKHVESHTCSQGRGTIVLASGAEVVFTTRSANAGRGLDRVDLEIYDEAYDLTEADMAALSPTKMNSDDPQTIYTSSAVNQDQHPNGQVLAAVRQRGHEGEEGLFFAEYMAPEELDRADPQTWRWANPSFGVIQTDKKLAAELRKFSTDAGKKSFDVEYLGRGDWPGAVDETPAVIEAEHWNTMTNPTPERVGPISLAVDATPNAEWWTVAAAQRTSNGRIHLEVGFHKQVPRADVVEYLVSLVRRWKPCALVIDRKSPAMILVPELLAAKIEPETTTAPQMVTACTGFYNDATHGDLSHVGDEVLAAAIAGATQRNVTGGGWAWNRTTNAVISPLVAATLARWGLMEFGALAAPPKQMPTQKSARTRSETDGLMAVGF
ncbi:hypothetical protein [Prescottella equi]|uniref:hypothetical protein n=1 Tax=Rhodococcus hoagii TaxID=43767 RepID=UPI0007CD81D9|nr:hypothetical protein [Prescottella equi]ORL01556.1 hypothetical protein A6F56_04345 [Prescottella equi]